MLLLLSSSMFLLSSIMIIFLIISIRKLKNKYQLLQDNSDNKINQLYNNYYTLSTVYVDLIIAHLNTDPYYINKLHASDKESVIGMLCINPSVLSTSSLESIINMLLEKVFNEGDTILSKNERLLLDITGKLI